MRLPIIRERRHLPGMVFRKQEFLNSSFPAFAPFRPLEQISLLVNGGCAAARQRSRRLITAGGIFAGSTHLIRDSHDLHERRIAINIAFLKEGIRLSRNSLIRVFWFSRILTRSANRLRLHSLSTPLTRRTWTEWATFAGIERGLCPSRSDCVQTRKTQASTFTKERIRRFTLSVFLVFGNSCSSRCGRLNDIRHLEFVGPDGRRLRNPTAPDPSQTLAHEMEFHFSRFHEFHLSSPVRKRALL